MNRAAAVTALIGLTNIPLAQFEAAASELSGGLVGEEWDADACALLCLRSLAPSLPLENFLTDVAWAMLDGISVHEIASSWRAQGEHARETPYTRQWGDEVFLVDTLAAHLRCVARGWASRVGYPSLVSLGVHECAAGRFSELALKLEPPAVYAPVTYSLIYGDTRPWADYSASIAQTMSGIALCGFIVALRRDYAPNHESPRSNPGFLAALTSGLTVHNEQEINNLLLAVDHLANKSVTLH